VLTFSDFILGFLGYAGIRGKLTFPNFNSPLWHIWLYEAKKRFFKDFPVLKVIGEFDWDAPWPISRSLKETAFGLGFVTERSSDFLRIRLAAGATTPLTDDRFMQSAGGALEDLFQLAQGIEGFFEK